ncbi:diamine N-acetyltransferase [Burkholderia multivorans]
MNKKLELILKIRIAIPGDAVALSKLKCETFRETFLEDGFNIGYAPDDLAAFEAESYSAEKIMEQLADPEHRTWIAENGDGRLIGYVHVGPCHLAHPEVQEADGEVYQLYLRREAQGSGAGRDLFNLALEYLTEARSGSLWLGVWSGNDKAIAFYEKAGFTHVGDYGFKVGATTDHEFIYRR